MVAVLLLVLLGILFLKSSRHDDSFVGFVVYPLPPLRGGGLRLVQLAMVSVVMVVAQQVVVNCTSPR